MALKIVYYGDPILRKKAEAINEINSEIRQLIDQMRDLLHEKKGLGLSAPQVGAAVRLFLTCVPKMSDNDEVEEPGKVKLYINPKLSNPSLEIWDHSEGCLSIPGVYPIVTRPAGITVEALDIDGNTFTEDLYGWDARVLMHENDHINGVLMIDRISSKERAMFDVRLREIKKNNKR